MKNLECTPIRSALNALPKDELQEDLVELIRSLPSEKQLNYLLETGEPLDRSLVSVLFRTPEDFSTEIQEFCEEILPRWHARTLAPRQGIEQSPTYPNRALSIDTQWMNRLQYYCALTLDLALHPRFRTQTIRAMELLLQGIADNLPLLAKDFLPSEVTFVRVYLTLLLEDGPDTLVRRALELLGPIDSLSCWETLLEVVPDREQLRIGMLKRFFKPVNSRGTRSSLVVHLAQLSQKAGAYDDLRQVCEAYVDTVPDLLDLYLDELLRREDWESLLAVCENHSKGKATRIMQVRKLEHYQERALRGLGRTEELLRLLPARFKAEPTLARYMGLLQIDSQFESADEIAEQLEQALRKAIQSSWRCETERRLLGDILLLGNRFAEFDKLTSSRYDLEIEDILLRGIEFLIYACCRDLSPQEFPQLQKYLRNLEPSRSNPDHPLYYLASEQKQNFTFAYLKFVEDWIMQIARRLMSANRRDNTVMAVDWMVVLQEIYKAEGRLAQFNRVVVEFQSHYGRSKMLAEELRERFWK